MSGTHEPNTLENEVKHTSKNIKSAVILVIITSAVQLISTGIYIANDSINRKQASIERRLDHQYEMLERQYDRQEKKYKEIDSSIIALRATMEEISSACKRYPIDRKKLAVLVDQRTESKVSLVQAFGGSEVIFGQDLYNNIRDFAIKTQEAEKIIDPCSPEIPPPIVWQKKQNLITEGLNNAMDKTANAMKKILDDY